MSEHAAPPLELRFDRLASLLPVFEAPDFSFGTWGEGRRDRTTGLVELPWFSLSEAAEQLVDIAYGDGWVLTEFDWGEWNWTGQAQRFEGDPETVADASARELAQLLTALIRLDRFSEGTLAEAGQSGLVTAVLRRIDRLHREAAG